MFATQRNLSNFYTFRRDAGILGILNHRNQRLQLLRSKSLEFFHDVCIIIQLQEPRVEFHLLGKRKSINVAVSDIAVYEWPILLTDNESISILTDEDMNILLSFCITMFLIRHNKTLKVFV